MIDRLLHSAYTTVKNHRLSPFKTGEKMASVDTAWLRMEHSTNLMLINGLMMFREKLDMPRLRQIFIDRLISHARFRQIAADPLGSPRWVPDPDFHPDNHIQTIGLPAPYGKAELEQVVSDVMSSPLDFSKPLWKIYHIENYEGGSALIYKFHHCLGDGIALIRLLLSVTDEEETEHNFTPSGGTTGRRDNQIVDRAAGLADIPRVLASALKIGLMPGDLNTPFRGRLGVRKSAKWSDAIPLEHFKQIGRNNDATVNDVLLTILTGAIRSYLQHHAIDLNDGGIRVSVPVNLRREGKDPKLGNRFGLVFMILPVTLPTFSERLEAVKAEMDRLKKSHEAVAALGILTVMGNLPLVMEELLVDYLSSKVSAVVTNVPGPVKKLHLAGSCIDKMMFWVPKTGALGLGISLFSYAGEVMVGLSADRGLVPDPELLIGKFNSELESVFGLPVE
ncbi:MAG: wax ester/triacylglycerol synthase family O-acyltransferase [Cyclonatronaceae bacterium]